MKVPPEQIVSNGFLYIRQGPWLDPKGIDLEDHQRLDWLNTRPVGTLVHDARGELSFKDSAGWRSLARDSKSTRFTDSNVENWADKECYWPPLAVHYF